MSGWKATMSGNVTRSMLYDKIHTLEAEVKRLTEERNGYKRRLELTQAAGQGIEDANIILHAALAAKDDALTTLETQLTYALKGYGPQISLQAMIDLARTALGATQEPQYLPIGHDPSHQHCDCGADECNCYDLPEPPREDCPVHGLGATQKTDVKDWVTGWRPRAGRGGATQKEEIKTPEAGNG